MFSGQYLASTGVSHVNGICSRTRVVDRVVNVTAAARISPPPAHALGPSRSPSTTTPRMLPTSGSIFNSTPACDAGTCVIPQFHNSVVAAVHNTPLPASASHAFSETPATGGIPYFSGTQTISQNCTATATLTDALGNTYKLAFEFTSASGNNFIFSSASANGLYTASGRSL